MSSLLSVDTLVESPFIIVKIGDYTFGNCSKSHNSNSFSITFPNYLNRITATKINGEVNTYNIELIYQIALGDDPNKFEKVFSTISNSRTITISYGDWNAPNYIYSNENALITNIKTRMDFNSSKITYSISCVGDTQLLASNKASHMASHSKPSTLIRDLIANKSSGILEAFPGMADLSVLYANGYLSGLSQASDMVVDIKCKENISTLDYLSYLVGCMTDGDKSVYKIIYHPANDHPKGEAGGAFFDIKKLSKIGGVVDNDSSDTYVLDVGYPSNNLVTNFEVTSDEQYSILYDYSGKDIEQNYVYTLDNNGNINVNYSNALNKVTTNMMSSQALANWWKEMTVFPITANVTLKGLVRPTLLMDYVRLNVIFYGQKHIYSGLYVITKENMQIDQSGYRTTLSLLRVGEDTSSSVSALVSRDTGDTNMNNNPNNPRKINSVWGFNV